MRLVSLCISSLLQSVVEGKVSVENFYFRTNRLNMLSKSLAAVFLLAPNAAALIYYAGVAESRGEFGFWSATSTKGTGLPGVFGVDYNLINQLYHRHQKRLRNSGPAQQHAVHDPSQQPMTGSVIGNSSDPTAATTAQFGVFWGELAGRFANNSKLSLG